MWTKSNLIKISLTGARNKVECNCCRASETFEQSDKFSEVTRLNEHGTPKVLKTPKAMVKHFLDVHFYEHVTRPATEQTKEAVAA